MSDSRRPFSELISELIELYQRLRAEESSEKPGIEVDGDVSFLLNHFDTIRETMDDEALDSLGEPVRDLLENLITELKREMGDDNMPTEKKSEASEPIAMPSSLSAVDILQDDIHQIDKQLKQKDLSTTRIDELLDKRSKLIEQQKKL